MRKLGRYICFLLITVMMLAGCGGGTAAGPGQTSGQETRMQGTETVSPQETQEEPGELTLLEVHDETGPGDLEAQESADEDGGPESDTEKETAPVLDENGSYSTKDDVALYIHTYGKLPSNYVTKKEAQKAGWESKKGNLASVLPGKSIGGDRFGNYEGLLPKSDNRKYYECDVDYWGGYRSSKRIIYSNDGLIYYTEDHYRSFEQLY